MFVSYKLKKYVNIKKAKINKTDKKPDLFIPFTIREQIISMIIPGKKT